MIMREYEPVELGVTARQEIIRAEVALVVEDAAAAVDDVYAVSGRYYKALPLPDVERGHVHDGKARIGVRKEHRGREQNDGRASEHGKPYLIRRLEHQSGENKIKRREHDDEIEAVGRDERKAQTPEKSHYRAYVAEKDRRNDRDDRAERSVYKAE